MRRLLLILAPLAIVAGAAFAREPVEGDWLIQDGSAKVRIAPCASHADQMCGSIIWLKDPNDSAGRAKLDNANPDATLRARPMLGLLMIRDFRSSESGRWNSGKIYDPGSGKTYDSKLKLNSDGTLNVAGCVLIICQSQTWKRAG
jgi:uncharacterized protein (DUF2147 family)